MLAKRLGPRMEHVMRVLVMSGAPMLTQEIDLHHGTGDVLRRLHRRGYVTVVVDDVGARRWRATRHGARMCDIQHKGKRLAKTVAPLEPIRYRTQRRVFAALRVGPATCEELAAQLGLTKSPVEKALGALRREGLVELGAPRKTGRSGPPPRSFRLTRLARQMRARCVCCGRLVLVRKDGLLALHRAPYTVRACQGSGASVGTPAPARG